MAVSVNLIAHVNRDDDLIEAWVQHYLHLGVRLFNLIVHGGPEQNQTLYAIKSRYPINIIDAYDGPFDVFEKRDRLTRGLARIGRGWVMLVDSDEFVELPYRSLERTIDVMNWLRADSLSAPMLQRFSQDGAADAEAQGHPSDAYPWCSSDLYAQLGQPQAVIDKYPLFRLTKWTALRSGGNHYPPNGFGSRVAPMLGVTHHYKWRATVRDRLRQRADSAHPYRGESQQYLAYLDGNGWQLPVTGAFRYSRAELRRRGLLTRAGVVDLVRRRAEVVEVRGGKNRVFAFMKSPAGVATRVAAARHPAVAVCGAGSGAQLFLQALDCRRIAVTHLVDRNPEVWGTTVHDIPVTGLDQALDAGVRVFVAGSITYAAEMAAAVLARATERGVDVEVFSCADQGGVA